MPPECATSAIPNKDHVTTNDQLLADFLVRYVFAIAFCHLALVPIILAAVSLGGISAFYWILVCQCVASLTLRYHLARSLRSLTKTDSRAHCIWSSHMLEAVQSGYVTSIVYAQHWWLALMMDMIELADQYVADIGSTNHQPSTALAEAVWRFQKTWEEVPILGHAISAVLPEVQDSANQWA